MSIELDACKFCGAKAVPNYYRGDHWVTCPQCKVGTATFGSAERAAASWNRRAQPAEEVQPVAWRIPINGMYEFFNSEADAIAERKEYDGGDPPMFTPEALYTRPPAADADRLDAERYRKATTHGIIVLHDGAMACVGKPEADAALDAIDAALAASKEKKE